MVKIGSDWVVKSISIPVHGPDAETTQKVHSSAALHSRGAFALLRPGACAHMVAVAAYRLFLVPNASTGFNALMWHSRASRLLTARKLALADVVTGSP